MKSSYLRAGVALACALGLAACGGSGGEVLLGGNVLGQTKDGLVLQNNGGSDLTITPGTVPFYFQTMIGGDSDYDVTIKTSPSNASCEVQNGKGKASGFNVTSILVVCTTFTHELKGTITGLTTGKLVLINGPDQQTITAPLGTFSMAKVAEDSPYAIKILTQPDGLHCDVSSNGVGTMGTADVSTVQVTCAAP
jgi:hypothetical protein